MFRFFYQNLQKIEMCEPVVDTSSIAWREDVYGVLLGKLQAMLEVAMRVRTMMELNWYLFKNLKFLRQHKC